MLGSITPMVFVTPPWHQGNTLSTPQACLIAIGMQRLEMEETLQLQSSGPDSPRDRQTLEEQADCWPCS
jgi:hypothetical protein